jgi:hypothetical protein
MMGSKRHSTAALAGKNGKVNRRKKTIEKQDEQVIMIECNKIHIDWRNYKEEYYSSYCKPSGFYHDVKCQGGCNRIFIDKKVTDGKFHIISLIY